MQNDYECPRCHSLFPSSNKIMHDLKCTEQNPLPINKNNNVEPPPIENKEEEHIPQLSELINNVNMDNDNNNVNNNNHINNNINNNNDINNNFDFNFYDNNNNNNFNNDDFNLNFYDNNSNNFMNNNNNNNYNNNNNDDFHLDAFNNINEPPKEDDFPQTFECDICHQTQR